MENSLYLGLSRQMVLRTDMNIVANNVANVDTNGYRGQNLIFEEYISKPRGYDDPLSFVANRGQYQVSDAGPLKATENPLDVALVGPGFMGVVGPDGEIAYTRDGSFQIDANGTLITQAGHAVASAGGGQITIPQGSTEVRIDEKGNVSNQDGQLGQIMIAEFDNVQDLEQFGDNLYGIGNGTAIEASNTRAKQGYLEGSNVKSVLEMSRMIKISREYQSLQNMMNSENERLREAIRKLTDTG
ncbi:MAG: flagellar basal-body rod protein FlgF [Bdellovibrionales bacterium]